MSILRLMGVCVNCIPLYTDVLQNKLLVGDDQVCLGENVTAVDLSVLTTYKDSV